MTFGTWRWWGCQSHAPAGFTPQKMFLVLIFTRGWVDPGAWYGRKEYVTEKSSDTTGNSSRDRPTSSAAPGPLHHPRPQFIQSSYQISYYCLHYDIYEGRWNIVRNVVYLLTVQKCDTCEVTLSARSEISAVGKCQAFQKVNKFGKDIWSCVLCFKHATYATSEVAVIAYLVTMPQIKRNLEKCFGNFVQLCVLPLCRRRKKWRFGDKVPMIGLFK